MQGEGYAQIPLYDLKGHVIAHALVDFEDWFELRQFRWYSNRGYPTRSAGRSHAAGGRPVAMHRQILGLVRGDGLEVDHINRNPLDNRRANLRIVTRSQNAQNVGSIRGSSSRYRGVYWDRQKRLWRARVRFEGRPYHIGYFRSEDDAGRAATEWIREHVPFAVIDP